jgi:hypothetical protein
MRSFKMDYREAIMKLEENNVSGVIHVNMYLNGSHEAWGGFRIDKDVLVEEYRYGVITARGQEYEAWTPNWMWDGIENTNPSQVE